MLNIYSGIGTVFALCGVSWNDATATEIAGAEIVFSVSPEPLLDTLLD